MWLVIALMLVMVRQPSRGASMAQGRGQEELVHAAGMGLLVWIYDLSTFGEAVLLGLLL